MADNKFNVKKYYDDLSRLFKSGPVVKHRIANKVATPGDIGVPVGTARAFLKHVNNAYTSALASYGQYSRLARYCLAGDVSVVINTDQGIIPIKELVERFEKGEKFYTYAYDKENKTMICVPVSKAWQTKVDEIFEVTFDDGLVLRCTKDHPIMLRDGSYCEAQNLKNGMAVMPFHKVVSVVATGKFEPVYDLTIDKYHNFAVGQIVGNSLKSLMVSNSDYQEMESMAEINSALNLYSEEVCAKGEHGEILRIDSTNVQIRDALNELFYDTLNIEFNAYGWIRNLPVSSDTPIPLLNGETIKICELSQRVKNGEDIWVYSVQDKTNKLVPGKVTWCDKNYQTDILTKVTFDDGSYVKVAPEHPFILRDGTQKRADQLKQNDSLMPFYRRVSDEKHSICGYEMIYDPSAGQKYKYTHRVVAHEINPLSSWENSKDKVMIHHCDFNKRNNNPSNLKLLTNEEHLKLHQQCAIANLHTLEITAKRLAGLQKYLRSEKRKNRLSKEMSGIYPSYFREYNHKVAMIENISEVDNVYCMTVVGPSGEEDRHNFALCGIKENGEINLNSGVFVANCKYGDQFLLIDHHPDYGVLNALPLPVNEVEREEGFNPENPLAHRYRWITQGNRTLENWQVIHFRMLGQDAFLPYGSCLSSQSTVDLVNGEKKPIKDVKVGDIVYSINNVTNQLIPAKVLAKKSNGTKNIFKIQTRHRFLEATDNHPFLMKDGTYRQLKDIKVGDEIAVANISSKHEGKEIKINKENLVKNENKCIKVSIPEYVNEDFAKLFGFMIGDGWFAGSKKIKDGGVHKNSGCLALGVDKEINDKYIGLVQSLFGVPARVKNAGYRKDCVARFNSSILRNMFLSMGWIDGAKNKRIPSWVFEARRNIQEAFLEGLYESDGWSFVDEWKCARYGIEMSNENLIKDIKNLVDLLGYKSGKIGSRVRSGNTVKINNKDYLIKSDNKHFRLVYYKSNLFSNKHVVGDCLFEKVLSIEEFGEDEVWDIQVDNQFHNFVAQGLVVHNSILEPARRTWRQLVLMEDAVMVYRIVRCLHGDSKIWTDNGPKNIKNINIGDKVYSYDQKNNKFVLSNVTDWVNNGKQTIYKIKSKHRSLKCNYNHPILVKDKETNNIEYVDICSLIPKRHQLVAPYFDDSNATEAKVQLKQEKYDWFGVLSDEGVAYYKTININQSKRSKLEEISENVRYPEERIKQFLYKKYDLIKGIPYKVAVEVCKSFEIPEKYLIKYPMGMFNLDRLGLPEVVDKEFARFFGFMIGDGFLSADFHQLGFATGIHEDINEYYSNILKKYCSSAIYSHDKRNIHEQVGKWCVNSQYFVNLMVDMGFTTSVYTKRIPTWVFSCSREIKEQFILGFMDADGWIKKNNTGAQSFEIELCNKKLTEDLKELCHQIGWNVSCEIRKRTKAAREIVGVCVNELDSYTIYLRKEENNSIFEDIVSVEKTDEYSDVYDIRVDNDLHNFVADGCVVHNSPERRVFYIGVGNVAPQDIPAFMEKAKTQLKRNQIVDSNSGRVDLRYNPLCNSLKTLIFLQNGKTITLGDLIKEWDSGKKDQWVYSVDLENKEVVPGKVVWAGITRKNADIVRVHLDNKKYIDVTPDHKFVMRDGTYVEAKDLKTGDALMPLYKKWLTKEDGHKIIGYEKIYDPFRQSYVFTNRNDVIQTCGFEAIEGKNVHHKDFDKLNNSPENLQLMKWKDHCKLHGEMVLEYKNHKVAKIEFLSEKEDTGCITVDTYHNFAIAGHCDCFDVTERIETGVYVLNSTDEDYFVPTRGEGDGTRIDTLPGGQFTGDIDDLVYIQNKLFAALKVPKSYLGYEGDVNAKSTLCLTLDTNIPLLDGRVLTLGEIIKEYESGKNNLFAYSVDVNNKKIIHGKIKWAGITQKQVKVMRLWLDNGKYLDCTPNHEIVLRDGNKVHASDLVVGSSIMPLYRRLGIRDYEQVYHPGEDRFEFTHKAVAISNGNYEQGKVIHHKDVNKHNNNPDNLDCSMTWLEHRRYHQQTAETTILREDVRRKNYEDPNSNWNKWQKSDEHRQLKSLQMTKQTSEGGSLYDWIHGEEIKENMSNIMKDRRKDENYRNLKIQQNKDKWNDKDFYVKHSGKNHWITKEKEKYDFKWLIDYCKQNHIKERKQLLKDSPIGNRWLQKLLDNNCRGTWRNFTRNYLDCVTNHKIVKIEYLDDLFDVGCLTIDNEFHNFAIESGIFVGNSQEDVRFARTIQHIQRIFIAELNKIAIIHLYSMGFKGEDLVNFEISMANPSTISELQRLELWRTKLEVASTTQEGMFDRHFFYDRLFKLSQEEIAQIEEGKRKDKLFDMELDAIQSAGEPQAEETPPSGGGESAETPTGDEAQPAGNTPEAGLPPPPGEEAGGAGPVSDAKDPMIKLEDDQKRHEQFGAPEELLGPEKKRKDNPFPNIKNNLHGGLKNSVRKNYNELERTGRIPFGESTEIEDQLFKARASQLTKFAEDLEKIGIAGKKKRIL